jgi:tRNA (guanine37-N1)-methyltransferase
MRFDVLTLFPEVIENYCDVSIMKRARESGVFEVNTVNPRDFTLDKHKKVDDTPYGGGAGMVLAPQPYVDAYESIERLENSITVMLSPQGEPLCEKLVCDLAKYDQIVMLCGHYEGFDERIRTLADYEISIGDYVLTGGEVPAMVLVDSIVRLLPGVIREESHLEDSFNENYLLDYPTYTKPREFRGMEVPEVLVSGNHEKIAEWRYNESLKRTKERRPDLLK